MSVLQAAFIGNRLNNQELAGELDLANKNLYASSVDVDLGAVAVGAVLISKSGNSRLILDKQMRSKTEVELFLLTKTLSGSLKTEKTLADKIDSQRLQTIIARKAGNPFAEYAATVKHLDGYNDILHNTAVLLGCGSLGKELRAKLCRADSKDMQQLHCGIDLDTGRIETFEITELHDNLMTIGFEFGPVTSPASEYVENILIYGNISKGLRSNLILASILANTIQNAQNLAGLRLVLDANS